MFKIPEFEEDVPKNHILFAKSLKKKFKPDSKLERVELNGKDDITHNIPQQDNNNIFTFKDQPKKKKQKKPKKKGKVNDEIGDTVAGKFVINPLLQKSNGDLKNKSKNKKNEASKNISNANNNVSEASNNVSKASNNEVSAKLTNHSMKKKELPKSKVAKKRKIKDTESKETIVSEYIKDIETDQFDEVILNAKKKKLNDALSKDNVEDDLFKEKREKKTKNNNSKRKPTVNGTEVNNNNKDIKKENSEKVVLPENEPVLNSNIVKHDSKKEKISKMLQMATKRTPIQKSGLKLRERMLEKLKSAQFRYLNEKLYTSSGTEAKELFQSDPTAFHTYHQGYQQQVKKWPVNPLDVIIKRILKMPKTSIIADLGCGDASLSRKVSHTVRSFDLVASHPSVEVCDMARTPLCTSSVDAAVYCLALMGTELTQYLVEANRFLKQGGLLLIAEVESRFDDVEAFTKELAKLGFKLLNLDKSHKVFFFMEFKKVTDPPIKKSKLPVLTLKPCFYKRR